MEAEPTKQEMRLCARLFLTEAESSAFIRALREGTCGRTALVLTPNADADYIPPCNLLTSPSALWFPVRAFVPDENFKSGSTSDYVDGLYYPLDLSSVWETAPLDIIPPPTASLDLCAAPGGKTFLLHARCRPTLHTANEVHPARRGILRENLNRCGLNHVQIEGLRPAEWSKREAKFDLILADVPCSGQSLLARGVKNPGCLNPSTVNGNAKRQKGIMLSILPLLASGGHLLYTTCTYDPDENEKVIAYILKRCEGLETVPVPSLTPFQSRVCDFSAYRLLPTDGFGAGGFCCLLRRA